MKFIDLINEDEQELKKQKFMKQCKKIMNFYEEGEYTHKTPNGEVELKYRLYHIPELILCYNEDHEQYFAKIKLFMSNPQHVLLFQDNGPVPDDMPINEIDRIKSQIIKTIAQRLKRHNIFLYGNGDLW